MKAVLAAAALAALTAACAPVIQGGPPMDLASDLRDGSRLGTIYMSSDWLASEDDFADTLTDEVGEELRRCMIGGSPLDVRIHIDDLRRADRGLAFLNGEGMHFLTGTVEFTDPAAGNAVVGRYPISVATSTQGRVGALFGDRQMMVSEEFGRAVCEQAFGRNPRGPSVMNATRG